MTLAREALRLATVRALRDRTWVKDRVRDSEQGPIDEKTAEKPLPEIVVYTDDGKFGGGGRDLFAGGVTNLVIEIVITQRMRVHVEGADDEYIWDSPTTDAGMELTLGMIERQVKVALADPRNDWAEQWRKFATTIGECSSQRGMSMREGVRFAGRQLVFPVTLPKDPTPGDALGPLWTGFLAAVEAAEDLQPVAPMLRAMVTGTAPDWPGWERVRFGYGLTADEARALQLAPPAAAEAANPDFEGVATEGGPSPAQLGPLP